MLVETTGFISIAPLSASKAIGADMTNETMKVLLMFLLIGGIQAAIHIPEMWAQHRAFLGQAMARIRSATIFTDGALQPVLIRHKSHKRQLLG